MELTLVPKIIAFPITLGISVLFTLSIIDLARKKQLFDGNNKLKRHIEKVCPLGGVSIFSAFWIGVCLTAGFNGSVTISYLFAGAFILFLTGVKDDLVGIPALKRLMIQIGIASLLFIGGLRLTYIPGLEIELPLFASYFLTIFLIGTIVNAYNFIDGINGLAGGLAMISTLGFAVLYYTSGLENYALMALVLAGAVGGFLVFNFGKAKIFMGDNGSTFIGVMLSFFTITFLQNHLINGGMIEWSPVVLVAILIVPLLDMLKVILSRLSRGISPFMGDRSHIHHLLLNAGLKQNTACFILYGWSIFAIFIASNLLPQNIILGSLLLFLIACLPYAAINFFAKIKNTQNEIPQYNREEKKQPRLHPKNAGDIA